MGRPESGDRVWRECRTPGWPAGRYVSLRRRKIASLAQAKGFHLGRSK